MHSFSYRVLRAIPSQLLLEQLRHAVLNYLLEEESIAEAFAKRGHMNGIDSNGNYWNYNKSSGMYTNTDGTLCTGKGLSRICM